MMNRTLFLVFFLIGILSSLPGKSQWITYHFEPDQESLTSNVPLNEISARAFRNFVKSFGYVPGSVWRKANGGYSASFYSADSVLFVGHYSSRGRPNGIFAYYTDRNAPSDIRSEMMYLYVGDRILYVDEFKNGEQAIFEIGLEEGNQLRVVQDKNGDVKTTQLFTRYRGNGR